MRRILIILTLVGFALFNVGEVFAPPSTMETSCISKQLVEQGTPLSPQNFQGKQISPTQVKLTWCNPNSIIEINEYRLTAVTPEGITVLSKPLPSDSTSFIQNDVKGDTMYSYHIIAIGINAKASHASSTTVYTTPTPTPPTPTPPTPTPPTPNFNLLIIVIGIIIAGGIGGFVFWNKRKNKKEGNDIESSNQQILTEKYAVCSNCNTKNSKGVQFCKQCGKDL